MLLRNPYQANGNNRTGDIQNKKDRNTVGNRADQLGADGQQERNNGNQHLGVVFRHNRSLLLPLETVGTGGVDFRINR